MFHKLAEEIVPFAKSFYDQRDSLHGWQHAERILYWAKKIWKNYLGSIDRGLIYIGAMLHGPINDDRDSVKTWLISLDLPSKTVSRIINIADESQSKSVPESLEGKILHDAHTIEGGAYFRFLKPLLTGTHMQQPLDATLEFIEHNVVDKGYVYLLESEAFLAEQELMAAKLLKELKTELNRAVDHEDFFEEGTYGVSHNTT